MRRSCGPSPQKVFYSSLRSLRGPREGGRCVRFPPGRYAPPEPPGRFGRAPGRPPARLRRRVKRRQSRHRCAKAHRSRHYRRCAQFAAHRCGWLVAVPSVARRLDHVPGCAPAQTSRYAALPRCAVLALPRCGDSDPVTLRQSCGVVRRVQTDDRAARCSRVGRDCPSVDHQRLADNRVVRGSRSDRHNYCDRRSRVHAVHRSFGRPGLGLCAGCQSRHDCRWGRDCRSRHDCRRTSCDRRSRRDCRWGRDCRSRAGCPSVRRSRAGCR
jgi:hypothetical protein